jgi:hypothetical protein
MLRPIAFFEHRKHFCERSLKQSAAEMKAAGGEKRASATDNQTSHFQRLHGAVGQRSSLCPK